MRPSPNDVSKILKWTHNDTFLLSRGFSLGPTGQGGSGPSNGFSIYLVTMMDVWGSIFREHFNDQNKKQYQKNIADFLKRLQNQYKELYVFDDEQQLAEKLRNGLVHNYGLRILQTGDTEDWPTIDVDVTGPIIDKRPNDRWHVDCWRLKDHILEIIDRWVVDHPEFISSKD
jgi:hypothetical protein